MEIELSEASVLWQGNEYTWLILFYLFRLGIMTCFDQSYCKDNDLENNIRLIVL
jgi:hypothetical protein